MNPSFHRFVDKIVKQTAGNQTEKDDLYEELMIHLEMSREQFIKEGFNEKQAEWKAMEHFGDAGEVGGQIRQAMFPFRKEMILALASVSIVLSFGVYMAWLLLENDAVIGWLFISVIISSCLFYAAIKPSSSLNRRLWLNTVLVIHILLYIYGALLASGIDNPISIALTFVSWLIILFGIILLYLTTLNNYQPSKYTLDKQFKVLHILNLTTGIIIVCATLFYLWGILVFSNEITLRMLIVFIPLLIWLIAYILQMNFLSKNKKIAYMIAIIPMIISTVIVGWFGMAFLV